MNSHQIKKFRTDLEKNLKTWIPQNDNLITKELALFDRLMSRRDFLKSTSLVALSAILYQGCSNKPPSQWDVIDDNFTLENYSDLSSVKSTSKIVVDADVLPSMVNYSPLRAIGSVDAQHIELDAVIESFNSHIMTSDSGEIFDKDGMNLPSRNYGIPEYVHLSRDDLGSDYYLSIYEQSHGKDHGLQETKIDLEGTSSFTLNHLVATNGSFHNRVHGSKVYNQKMLLLANLNDYEFSYNTSSAIPLQLYYQSVSSALLMPSVALEYDLKWESLDLMKVFKESESHTFSSYRLVDANTYHDGSKKSFIYGTIRFDEYYNYGFTVTFDSITDTKPTVTFFAPEFLSIKSTTIKDLKTLYEDINPTSNHAFDDFGIFANQTFKPLSHLVDSDGNISSEIVFSFVSYDIASDDVTNTQTPVSGLYEFKKFVENETDDIFEQEFFKRFLVRVDSSSGGVVYPFKDYKPELSLVGDASSFTLTFENTLIPSVDVWSDVYSKNLKHLDQMFVRFVRDESSHFNVLLATPYADATNLGVSHKSVNITPSSTADGFSEVTVDTTDSFFNDALYDDGTTVEGYKELWYDEMKVNLEDAPSLASCVDQNGGDFDFYSTQNHQGLLRSYFMIRHLNVDESVSSYLVGFNEKGLYLDEESYEYMDYNTLHDQILADDVPYFPPMPLEVDPLDIYQWHGVVSDAEVLYKSMAHNIVDESTRTLIDNDGSLGDVYSYVLSSCDSIDKHWYMHEEQKRVQSTKESNNLVNADLHQVHLQTKNIYNLPVTLEDDAYVEVRFSKKLVVKDMTDHLNPVRHHVNELASLFLKTDLNGRVALEIDAGNQESQYQGATLEYRLVGASTLALKQDRPVAFVISTGGVTSEFQEFNISFHMYERFSTEKYESQQSGRLATTVYSGLVEHLDPNFHDSIPSFSEAFSKLHDDSKPDNDLPIVNLAEFYASSSLPDGELRLSPLNSAIVFKSHRRKKKKKKRFHPFAWVKHVKKRIKKRVKKIAKHIVAAVKKTADKLAKPIDDVLSDIDNGIADFGSVVVGAAGDIAAAAEKLWDVIDSFAEKFWNWLKSLFDMDASWEIAQEIKQMFADQLKPIGDASSLNQQSKNLYSFLGESEAFIKNEIDTLCDMLEEDIDDAIDSAFKQTQDVDNQVSSAKDKQKNSNANSTNTHHLFDQVKRIIASFSVDGVTCDMDTSSGSVYDISASTFENVTDSTLAPIENVLHSSVQNISQLFIGGSMQSLQSLLATDLKTLSGIVIDDVRIIGDTVSELPLAVLSDKSSCTSDLLVETERTVLDMLGYLLFADKSKFIDIEDFGAFLMGYHINIVDTLLGAPIEDSDGNHIDVGTQIKDGTFRTTLNEMGSQMEIPTSSNSAVLKRAVTPGGLPRNVYIAVIVLEAMDFVEGVIQHIFESLSTQDQSVKNLLTGISLVRPVLMIADIATVSIANRSSTSDPLLLTYKIAIGVISGFVGLFGYLQGKYEGKFPNYDDKGDAKAFMIVSSILTIFKVLLQIILLASEKYENTEQTLINLNTSITVIDILSQLTGIVQNIGEYSLKNKGEPVLSNPALTSVRVGNTIADLSIVSMKISMNGIRLAEVPS